MFGAIVSATRSFQPLPYHGKLLRVPNCTSLKAEPLVRTCSSFVELKRTKPPLLENEPLPVTVSVSPIDRLPLGKVTVPSLIVTAPVAVACVSVILQLPLPSKVTSSKIFKKVVPPNVTVSAALLVNSSSALLCMNVPWLRNDPPTVSFVVGKVTVPVATVKSSSTVTAASLKYGVVVASLSVRA